MEKNLPFAINSNVNGWKKSNIISFKKLSLTCFVSAFVFLVAFVPVRSFAAYTLLLGSNALSESPVCAGFTKTPIHSFSIAISGKSGTLSLTSISDLIGGTFVSTDITKFQLWYNSVNNFGDVNTVQLGSDAGPIGSGSTLTFNFTSPTLAATTYYFWITADIKSNATNNNTIYGTVMSTSNFTTDSKNTKQGSADPSLSQTIIAQSITLTSGNNNQSPCINTAINNITYNVGGAADSAYVTPGTLPSGVTGSYDKTSKVFTISGTPTVAGTYNYTVTTWGSCSSVTATGTITVQNGVTISLAQGSGSPNQSPCINSPISSITYSVAGGTGASATGLPPGVTGVYSNGTFTISGKPTSAGTYSYTVTATGTCGTGSATGTITVGSSVSPTISANGTTTFCTGGSVTLTTESYTTYQWYNGTIISGATSQSYVATAAGTYTVSVSNASGCSGTSAGTSVSVSSLPTASITSGDATVCSSGGSTNISGSVTASGSWTLTLSDGSSTTGTGNGTFSIAVSPTANTTYTITSLVANCSANASGLTGSETVTVSQEPAIATQPQNVSVCGTKPFSFTVAATGDNLTYQWYKNGTALSNTTNITGVTTSTLSYKQANSADNGASFTVVVKGASSCTPVTSDAAILSVDQSIAITQQPADQTVCTNDPVTFSVTASAGSDPLTYQWRKNGVNISGETSSTLTINSVTSSDAGDYDVVITGPSSYACADATSSTATLTVTPKVGTPTNITVSSGTEPTCQLSNSTTITSYSTTATNSTGFNWSISNSSAGSIDPSTGVMTWANGFSGTVDIQVTANGCGGPSNQITRTVTVGSNSTIALTSGSASQPGCINTAVTSIKYTVGGGGTGASITAGSLPTGVTGSYSGGIFTISGIPTVSGTFNYTVTTTGPCNNPSLSGSITVNANSTLALTSAANTSTQTVCVNNAITTITYSVGGGATGASITAGTLPAGITPLYNSTSKAFTMSGTPTETGTFNYTVTTTGPCNNPSLSGTITVNANATISLSSASGTAAQTICLNSSITDIKYTIGGGATGASVSGLPSGVSGSYSAGVFTISGIPSVSGTYNYTVTATGGCSSPTAGGSITINAPYAPTITATPLSTTICSGQSVTLDAGSFAISDTIHGGDFNNANAAGWSGAEAANNNSSSDADWGETSGPKTFNNKTYNSTLGSGGKFMIVTGTTTCDKNSCDNLGILTTPTFSTVGMTSGALTWYQGYNLSNGTIASVDISTDGGSTYTNLVTYTGPVSKGFTGNNNDMTDHPSIDLTNYLGQSNLKVRFYYVGTSGSNWAIDDVILAGGTYQAVSYSWGTGQTSQSITVSPTTTTTYKVTSSTSSCGSSSSSITITVNTPAAITAQPTSQNACSGSATFSVTASGTTPAYQWKVSIDGGTTFNNITGATSSSYTVTNPTDAMSGYKYEVIVTSAAPCSSIITSDIVSLTVGNIWTGTNGTNFNLGSNWSCGSVPGISDKAIIPNVANLPILNSANTEIGSLNLQTGASLDLNGKNFTINGDITGDGKMYGDKNSNLILNGTTTSIVYFDQNNDSITNVIRDLTIGSGTFTVGSRLYVLHQLNSNGGTLNANGKLTIRSTSIAGTARVAAVSGTISGNVTVERFIPAWRAYRFISPSVTTTTSIQDNWMEGGHNSSIDPPPYNPNSGYGTNITGRDPLNHGFDPTITTNPSLFIFNTSKQQWDSVPNSFGKLKAGSAYSLMVRGDRSIDMRTNTPDPTNTILRATGTLFTGDTTVDLNTSADKYAFVGNPYASPVDFGKMFSAANTNNITSTYWAWNPQLGTRGAYAYYNATQQQGFPDTINNYINQNIQSGQAFFVRTNGASPSIQFQESFKSAGNTAVFREPHPITKLSVQLLLNLNTGMQNMADGVVAFFDKKFSSAIGNEDSYKFTNSDENLAIDHNGISLSMEGRPPVTADDTIHLKMWQFRQTSYYLKLKATNFSPDVTAFVQDNYLHKQTPVDLSSVTELPFSIDKSIAASFAKDRFIIVFRPATTLPVTLTNVRAYQKDDGIQVDWTAEAETNIESYQVEKSADGQHFNNAATEPAKGNNSLTQNYGWFDENANAGNNFYRIEVIEKSGAVKYSNVVKVSIAEGTHRITVFPNPIKDNLIKVQFNNMEKGRYSVVLYNTLGQKLYSSTIDHTARSGTYMISLGRLISKGTYTLHISKGDMTTNERVVVE